MHIAAKRSCWLAKAKVGIFQLENWKTIVRDRDVLVQSQTLKVRKCTMQYINVHTVLYRWNQCVST